jgi:transposase
MEVVHAHCAGLDVHKDTVVACVRHRTDGKVTTTIKTFNTATQELLALSDWLSAENATHIAMEATGVYWKPVWNILSDGEFELVLGNAAHIKNVPGRKTGAPATGLCRWGGRPGSRRQVFVAGVEDRRQGCRMACRPDGSWMSQWQLRARSDDTGDARSAQNPQATCTGAHQSHAAHTKNVGVRQHKLDSVVSNVVGVSGRRMLEALIAGQTDPKELAAMAHGRFQATPAELEVALRGRVTAHHRFMLKLHLDQIDSFDEAIARIDKEVKDNDKNVRATVELLKSIPGVGSLAAAVIVSEIGIEINRFATVGNLVSWAGLCPRNDESAGKRRSNRLKAGAPWLKTTLVQCAWGAARSKGTYLHAQDVRIRARRGNQKSALRKKLGKSLFCGDFEIL